MGWFGTLFSGSRNNGATTTTTAAPVMTARTSVRLQQFHTAGRTGSLVLSPEDLQAVQIHRKIEETKRRIERDRMDHLDELKVLRHLKETVLQQQLTRKLETELDDISVYQRVIQDAFLQDGLLLAPPGDGRKEAELFQAIHKAEIKEKMRVLFQQKASQELMEIYRTTPAIQERMGEREAKMLSLVFQKDALVTERRELYEKIVRIQKEMIDRLEKANQQQILKHYEEVRAGILAEDGDLLTRRQVTIEKNYSSRASESPSPEESPKKEPMGLKDIALEDEQSSEAHIGEVKKNYATMSSGRRPMGANTSKSPTRLTTQSRSPIRSSPSENLVDRGELSSRTAASTTTRVRARPAPRRGADRSPTRQQPSGSELAAARRAAGERVRQPAASSNTTTT